MAATDYDVIAESIRHHAERSPHDEPREHLEKLKALLGTAVPALDPDLRLAIIWTAIDFGSAKFRAGLDEMEKAWRRSTDRRYGEALALSEDAQGQEGRS